MSSFKVDVTELDAVANGLAAVANDAGVLNLPKEDFGSWTGGPDVSQYLQAYIVSINRAIDVFVQSIEILGQDIVAASEKYSQAERANTVSPGAAVGVSGTVNVSG